MDQARSEHRVILFAQCDRIFRRRAHPAGCQHGQIPSQERAAHASQELGAVRGKPYLLQTVLGGDELGHGRHIVSPRLEAEDQDLVVVDYRQEELIGAECQVRLGQVDA